MSYVKQTWATGDVVTAEKMNYIENGIANAGEVFIIQETTSGNTQTLNKTWNEINTAARSGKICYLDNEFDLGSLSHLSAFNGTYSVNFNGLVETYETSDADGYPSYTSSPLVD